MKTIFFRLFTFLFLFAGFAQTIISQETIFGKNKIQYKNFNWYFIQTDHFDIYFTDGGKYIAEYSAHVAEESYKSISRSFGYQIFKRIPLILYNSHNDFQQTNVVNIYLEEGIGGVTELFKNRVIIPFEGDYKKFRHVIHHELVHAVINDMFYGGSIQSIISNNITLQLPLWFNEGLAEYEALKWDTESDMYIRDVTIHEKLPPIDYLNGYLAYRGGQAVWFYIASKYGEQKVGEILNKIRSTRSVDQGFKSAIGLSVKELDERWQKEMKVKYWPDIAKREEPHDYARRLTDHTKDGSFFNTSPAISPQGDLIAFISNRDDYFDIFLMNTFDGKIVSKLVKGQRTADFEELHLLTPGMSWSPDGKKIALSSKSGASDAIYIIDVYTKNSEKIEFDLDGIFTVDWSPSGDKLTFVGNTSIQSDIYIYDLKTSELINLTNDVFSDSEPMWSHDGKSIYFVSDRKDFVNSNKINTGLKIQFLEYNYKDIYKIDIETKYIERILNLPESDQTSPVATSDGKNLMFISDKNGINNIYNLNLETKELVPLTNSLSGIYQISLSRDMNKLAFSSLSNGAFNIYVLRTPLEKRLKTLELEPTDFVKQKYQIFTDVQEEISSKDTIKISDDIIIKTDAHDSTDIYEDNVKIDFKNYVFTPSNLKDLNKGPDTSISLAVKNNIDSEGNLIVNKYKLNFSPDIVYGNAGYNTYFGVQGSTIMTFSDMLGNHQIYLLTNFLGDLKNSDLGFAYIYLQSRIDYGIQGFHSARFLILGDQFGFGSLYRYRTYGAALSASYPFTKFNRLEFGLNWITITKENMDFSNVPIERRQVLMPSLSYVHDNTLWGITSPANGRRYNLTIYGTPNISNESLSFVSVLCDYRNYLRLGKYYVFASRLAAGASFGANPQRFIIGGVDNWLNREFTNDQIPIENAEDFLFLTSGVPLRGHIYNTRIGTKYFLVNNEIRFPLLGYLAAGPLPIFWQSLTGVLFLDVGAAWKDKKDFQAFAKNSEGTYIKDLLAGTGTGVRIYLLGFLVKFDVGWWFNLQGFSKPRYYISLGTDF